MFGHWEIVPKAQHQKGGEEEEEEEEEGEELGGVFLQHLCVYFCKICV